MFFFAMEKLSGALVVAEALNVAPESSALPNLLMKDLPLSLRPPPEGGYPPLPPVEWGWASLSKGISCIIHLLIIDVVW